MVNCVCGTALTALSGAEGGKPCGEAGQGGPCELREGLDEHL